jgi:hypothetical protein
LSNTNRRHGSEAYEHHYHVLHWHDHFRVQSNADHAGCDVISYCYNAIRRYLNITTCDDQGRRKSPYPADPQVFLNVYGLEAVDRERLDWFRSLSVCLAV